MTFSQIVLGLVKKDGESGMPINLATWILYELVKSSLFTVVETNYTGVGEGMTDRQEWIQ